MRIGVIDDQLAENFVLGFKSVQKYEINKGKVESVTDNKKNCSMTHGTSCCAVLNSYLNHPDRHFLLYIDIMKDNQLDMGAFIVALEFCLNSRIDILCLSIGTTMLSNAGKIYPIIKKLSEDGVFIIAASSNANLVTYPAAFGEVLGTKALTDDCFTSQKMYYILENDLGVNVGIKTEKDSGNSFSSPLILAKLLNMVQDKIVNIPREMIYKVINKEIKYATQKQTKAIEYELLPKDNEPVPVVIIEREEVENYHFMEKVMQYLFEIFNYESVCVVENEKRNCTFRFINFNSDTFHKQLQNRFNRDVDVLFLSISDTNSIFKSMDILEDLYIKISRTKTILSASKYGTKHYGVVDYKTICSDIVRLLTERD